jgi:hypothetical protein
MPENLAWLLSCLAGNIQTGPNSCPVLKRWIPPQQGTLKINVDVAFNHLNGGGGTGVVIRVRDWDDNLKLTGWRVILHCRDVEEAQSQKKDVEEAKAIVCREGVHMAQRWPDWPMILESDC